MEKADLFHKRRLFIAAAACTPALAVAALINRRPAATVAPLPEKSIPAPASQGYHETEHIRKYYRLAGLI